MATGHTEACCKPAPPAEAEHVGKFETVAGLEAYVTGSRSASAAVVIVSDVFGHKTPLLHKMADKVAAAGFLTVVPDFLEGDPFVGSDFSTFPAWRAKHLPTEVPPKEVKRVVQAVKETTGIQSVGVAGCCWGGKVVVIVGKDKEAVKAVVQLHPGGVEQSDYEEVAVPIMVLAAPTDGVEKYEALLESRKDLPSYVNVFPNVLHGWTVRYDETDATAVQNASKAHTLMIDWFSKYL